MIEAMTSSDLRRKELPGKVVVLSVLFAVCSITAFAQDPTPTPSASPQELQVPAVAADFHPAPKPLPELNRVGVEMDQQRPLSLREALAMALENNKDIEVARENVRIAEFDLHGSQGAYDPRFTTQAFYERIESPISSFLAGGTNGSTIQTDYTTTARLEGQTPKFGGNYRLDFSSVRLNTNNIFTALNPQYPTSLAFTYTQPLWRGLKIDQTRRQIQIARK